MRATFEGTYDLDQMLEEGAASPQGASGTLRAASELDASAPASPAADSTHDPPHVDTTDPANPPDTSEQNISDTPKDAGEKGEVREETIAVEGEGREGKEKEKESSTPVDEALPGRPVEEIDDIGDAEVGGKGNEPMGEMDVD